MSKDPTACLPQDLEAWRRLAHELLIQAAKDAEGRGYLETKEDAASAKRFFFSVREEYVNMRCVWFGMAGLKEPPQAEMGDMVLRLVSYGCNKRRSSLAR